MDGRLSRPYPLVCLLSHPLQKADEAVFDVHLMIVETDPVCGGVCLSGAP